jgi:UrcA family protein
MRSIFIIATAVAALVAASASAQTNEAIGREPISHSVVVTAYDFRSPEAVRALHEHLARVAAQICDSEVAGLQARAADRACARQALDQAVRQIDRPVLTALHGGRDLTRLAELSEIH